MASMQKGETTTVTKIDSKERGEHELQELENVHPASLDRAFDEEEEPPLHIRTWLALAAFFLLNYVQVLALQAPASVLTYIGRDLGDTESQAWIIVCLSLIQGVLGPIISTLSDTFQARKLLLVGSCAISFVGACIAPGSNTLDRLIGANILIGAGFASVPLAYAVPSEILPRRWRPAAQAGVGIAATLATITGPFMIGALTKRDPHTGWRMFYWFQAALWGTTTLAILVAYNPPKRHTSLDHLSFWRKLGHIDLIGCGLLIAGLALFMTGLGLGGNQFSWTDAHTLAPIIIGLVILVIFGIYEWKGTQTGIIHHDLFRGGRNQGRTFTICVALLFTEALIIFGFGLFFPILIQVLFTNDPVLIVAHLQACWAPGVIATVGWGYLSTRYRTIREPLLAGFIIFTAGIVGMSTLQPGQVANAYAFSVLLGIGVGAPIVLVITGVQLSTPHKLIATATSITTSARALAGAIFSAIYVAAVNPRLTKYLPEHVGKAAATAGLPAASIPEFIKALAEGQSSELMEIPGVTPTIVAQGVRALQQAYVDAIRIVFIIAVPFGVLACIACCFLGDLKQAMNYHVDAPVEKLHQKAKDQDPTA